MSKSTEIVNAIQALQEKASQPAPDSLRQFVIDYFDEIQSARAAKVTWEDLAKAFTEHGTSISATTLRRYYYAYLEAQSSGKKKKKRKKKQPSTPAVTPEPASPPIMMAAPPPPPGFHVPETVHVAELIED